MYKTNLEFNYENIKYFEFIKVNYDNASNIYYITKEIEDDEMIDIMNDTRKWIKVQEKNEIPISAKYIYCK